MAQQLLDPPAQAVQQHKETLKDFEPMLARYRRPEAWRSVWQIVTTLALFFTTWTLAYLSLSVSYWLTLLLSIPAGLSVVRLFIIQHDCGHRSFFKSKSANDWVGSFLSVLTFTPYHCWRREHAAHHATSGDLDRRGRGGEIWTMTVKEYQEASWKRRLLYRLYRNPFVLLTIGSIFHFVVMQRLTVNLPKARTVERRSIHWTNFWLAITLVSAGWLLGPMNLIAVQLPTFAFAATVGVWMFYIQHQYEDAFWTTAEDWDYVKAAMEGSSYYRLPKVFQWFTANIGLHHIHHLDSRIPNYHLQKCHDANPEFHRAIQFSFTESLPCIFLKLWDEDQKQMIRFKDLPKASK